MSRKNKEIVLFNKNIKLFSRSAEDFINWIEFTTRNSEKIASNDIYAIETSLLTVTHDSLKLNYVDLPFYKIFEKMRLKKLFSINNLKKNLSFQELNEISEQVLELEGMQVNKNSNDIDIKKKDK